MAAGSDYWYIRLHDGRTIRARSAEVLRDHLQAGRIPWQCLVRRSGDEAWLTLDRVPEFADLAPPAAVEREDRRGGRGRDVPPVGVRGLIDELINAVDRSFRRIKLVSAGLTGILLALGLIVVDELATVPLDRSGRWLAGGVVALFFLFVVSVWTYLLTQATYIELTHVRPATGADLRAEAPRQLCRLLLAQGLIVGLVLGIVILLRWGPGWLAEAEMLDARTLALVEAFLRPVRLLLEVLCWPMIGLAVLLLGPILIVEEGSLVQALGTWLDVLSRHLGRIYLYEALALVLGVVFTLPLLLPVLLAGGWSSEGRGLSEAELITLRLLTGVALTPLLAYLPVANVFIYLNLRYEFFASQREQ